MTSWHAPWTDPRVAQQQADVMRREYDAWLYGKPHPCFDSFKELFGRCQSAPKTVLDAGCGAGIYCEVLRTLSPSIQYYGCDISTAAIDIATKSHSGNFAVQDACKLPYLDNAFELVISSSCIGSVANWQAALSEAFRVSSRWVMLARTALDDIGSDYERHPICREIEKDGYGQPMMERLFNLDKLDNFIEEQYGKPIGSGILWNVSGPVPQHSALWEKK